MLRPMVKTSKIYTGTPGFIAVFPTVPKGAVRLATGIGSRVMLNA